MERIKQQLLVKFPFMKNAGTIHKSCTDPLRIISDNNKARTLILLCGVEGSGKTTFAQNYLKDYNVINLDELLKRYLATHQGQPFTLASNEELNQIFFAQATDSLKQGVTILDCANHDILFRTHTLSILKPYYDKVIMFVFNPTLATIKKRIMGQIILRLRPNLWEDVNNQYRLFQEQLKSGIFALGIDDVYILKQN